MQNLFGFSFVSPGRTEQEPAVHSNTSNSNGQYNKNPLLHRALEKEDYRTGATGAEHEDGGEARVTGLADVAGSQAASVLGYCTHGLPAEPD